MYQGAQVYCWHKNCLDLLSCNVENLSTVPLSREWRKLHNKELRNFYPLRNYLDLFLALNKPYRFLTTDFDSLPLHFHFYFYSSFLFPSVLQQINNINSNLIHTMVAK
jgi:hypothetical protein